MLQKKIVKRNILGLTLLASLLLTGCTTIPQSIRGEAHTVSPVTYEQLTLAPGMYQGQEVRLGGRVINVVNLPRQTILEIAVLPLNENAQPKIHDAYQGRILAYSDKFLDPVNFRNRYVTVLGKMDGTENKLIGRKPYNFLKVSMMGYQVWDLENTFMPDDGWIYAWSPDWGVPPPGYFYTGPEAVTESSYLVP